MSTFAARLSTSTMAGSQNYLFGQVQYHLYWGVLAAATRFNNAEHDFGAIHAEQPFGTIRAEIDFGMNSPL